MGSEMCIRDRLKPLELNNDPAKTTADQNTDPNPANDSSDTQEIARIDQWFGLSDDAEAGLIKFLLLVNTRSGSEENSGDQSNE